MAINTGCNVFLLSLVLFSFCLGYINAHGSMSQPNRTCPSMDSVTHECYDITMVNTSCRVPSDVITTTEYGLTIQYEWKSCLVYQCRHRGCCTGWVSDMHGVCTRATTELKKDCQNGGLFNSTSLGCDCPTGYTGELCEKSTCEGWCDNGGWCEIVDSRPSCICPSQFLTGVRCEQVKCEQPCMNGGSCVKDGVQGVCQCPLGYIGDRCQYEINPNCPVLHRGDFPIHPDVIYSNHRKCTTDEDCGNDIGGTTICCYSGTTGVCMKPTPKTCTWVGGEYAAGATFRPSSCEVCVCQVWGDVQCTFIQCPDTQCSGNHTAIKIQNHCCKVCPGDDFAAPEPPRFYNCPDIVPVPVSETGSTATLPEMNLLAMDWMKAKLNVWLSNKNFTHSHSTDVQTNMHYVTAYSDCDQYGRRTECVFRVLVTDRVAPVFRSCPTEMYAFTDERITWTRPVASDNVGIFRMEANGDEVYGKHLAVGTYPVSYTVWDFDQNKAICAFVIKVVKSYFNEVNIEDTMRGRSNNPFLIVAACCGGMVVMIAFFAIVCIRSRACTYKRTRPRTNHRHEESIYAICGPPTNGRGYENVDPLPVYTPPTNPPCYDELDHEFSTYVNTTEARLYAELNHTDDLPKYENVVRGEVNTSFINDQHQLEYMKI